MNYYDLNGMIDIPKSESMAFAQNKKQIEEIDKQLSEHINEEKVMIEGEIQSLTENIDNAAAEAQRKLEDTAASINSDMKELSNRVDRDMETVNNKIENTVDNLNASVDTKLDTVNNRVDNIIANNSETDGNTELIDIRTSTNGMIYGTAGAAVRGQIAQLDNLLNRISDRLDTGYTIINNLDFIHGRIAGAGQFFNNPYTWRSKTPFKLKTDASVKVKFPENVSASIWYCENEKCESGTLRLANIDFINSETEKLDLSADYWYMLCIFNTDDEKGDNHTSPDETELSRISFAYLDNDAYYSTRINALDEKIEKEITDRHIINREIYIPHLEYVHGRIAGSGTHFTDGSRYITDKPFYMEEGNAIYIKFPDNIKCGLWCYNDQECTEYLTVYTIPAKESQISVSKSGYWLLCVENADNPKIAPSEDELQQIYISILPKNGQISRRFSEMDKKIDAAGDDNYATPYHDEEDILYKKIQQCRDKDTLIFTLCTDVHGTNYPDTYSPPENSGLTGSKGYKNYRKLAAVLAKLSQNIGADFIANLGDTIASATDEAADDYNHEENKYRFTEFSRLISSTYIPYLYTIGHHEMFKFNLDGNTKSEICGSALRYNRYLNAIYNKSDDDCAYYYIDFEAPAFPDVRYISLDCCTDNSGAKYSDKELSWLENTALNTDKPVIIVGHMGTRKDNCGANPINGERISQMLNTFVSGGGRVLAFIHGHTHCDNIIEPSVSGDKYVDISTLCSWSYKPSIPAGLIGNPTVEMRIYGEYTEYAIDTYVINCKTGKINIFRFGAGADRNYTPS